MKAGKWAFLLLLALPVVASAASQGKDDEWKVTVHMKMTAPMAMTMPAITQNTCTPANADQGPPPMKNGDCKVEKFEKNGQRADFKVVCHMQNGDMTGEGWTEKTDDTHYKGEMNIQGSSGGMSIAMSMDYSGVRVGSCTAKSAD
ncbi:MAG TPA: DUF3617 family protein [Rhodanobacteraceae bacterium]|nr:DUF3617 family protein [Rhodanobacteraceae bacterium]